MSLKIAVAKDEEEVAAGPDREAMGESGRSEASVLQKIKC